MKKLLCVIAACLMIAAVSTSCNKNCTCKTYVNDSLTATAEDIDISNTNYSKCSDMDSKVTLLGQTTEVKCR